MTSRLLADVMMDMEVSPGATCAKIAVSMIWQTKRFP